MLPNSVVRKLIFKMKPEMQLISDIRDFEDLKEVLELNVPTKIITESSSLEEAKKESEEFMKSNFNMHKIYYANQQEVNDMLEANYQVLPEKELLKEFNKSGRKTDIYDIPYNLTPNDYWYANICNVIIPFANKELIREENVVYSGILLSNKINNLTSRILTHEVTHSQIDSNKGAINYYHNYEMIPMFLELIHNSKNKQNAVSTDMTILIRGKSLLDYLNYIENVTDTKRGITDKDIEISTYLISTLEALNLYEIYINSSVSKQKDILGQIQKIFDGEMLVEELIEKNDIYIEDGIESTKRLIKEKKKEYQM